jgi:hypothetical protein
LGLKIKYQRDEKLLVWYVSAKLKVTNLTVLGVPVRHAKKEVFSLVRVSCTIAKSIEINSFSFYKKTLQLEVLIWSVE